jgi:hypothetical protein
MLKYYKVPLWFLFAGSLLGVFLRLQLVSPTAGVNYTFFLHTHSHVMFLGWIFNALYIGFVSHHVPPVNQRFFRVLFIAMQGLVVAMLISFPLQGYGFYSILFSTMHTLAAFVFMYKFFRVTRQSDTVSLWYARIALVFFIVSTIGPFSLGYLMANGMGHSQWYYFALYFYLHFQYNGFFLFGVFSLIFHLYQVKGTHLPERETKRVGWVFAIACLPAYFLSVLWAKPGMAYNALGGIAAIAQISGFIILLKAILKNITITRQRFNKHSQTALTFVLTALGLKFALQLASAFPKAAQLAFDLRPIVIGYIHLVLLGVLTLAIFVWYLESSLLPIAKFKTTLQLFLTSFIGMEVCLIMSPWWEILPGESSSAHWILFFSVILALATLALLISSHFKTDENHSLA